MVIALLSDFGTQDHYVGAMKGVLARLAPNARAIDLTHQIPPSTSSKGTGPLPGSPAFPAQDRVSRRGRPRGRQRPQAHPGRDSRLFFLGPDNGLLSMALAEQKIRRIVHLNNEKYFQKPLSATFHGRDLFAPSPPTWPRAWPRSSSGRS